MIIRLKIWACLSRIGMVWRSIERAVIDTEAVRTGRPLCVMRKASEQGGIK